MHSHRLDFSSHPHGKPSLDSHQLNPQQHSDHHQHQHQHSHSPHTHSDLHQHISSPNDSPFQYLYKEVCHPSTPHRKHKRNAVILHSIMAIIVWAFGFLYESSATATLGYFLLYGTFSLLANLATHISQSKDQPSKQYSFGLKRVEVLFDFANVLYLLFIILYCSKEILEHGLYDEEMFKESAFFAFLTSLASGLNYHILSSDDISGSKLAVKYGVINRHSATLLRFFDHFLLHIPGVIVSCEFLYIWLTQSQMQFPLCDLIITLVEISCITLFAVPLSINIGKVLLQTTPPQMVKPLEKTLLSILNTKGVYNLTNVHFWKLSNSHYVSTLKLHIHPSYIGTERSIKQETVNKMQDLVGSNAYLDITIDIVVAVGTPEFDFTLSQTSAATTSTSSIPSPSIEMSPVPIRSTVLPSREKKLD